LHLGELDISTRPPSTSDRFLIGGGSGSSGRFGSRGRLIGLAEAKCFQDLLVGHVIRSRLLDVVEKLLLPPFLNDERTPVLILFALHVTTQSEGFDPGLSRPSGAGYDRGHHAQHTHLFKSQRFVAFRTFVNVKITGEKVSGDEVFDAEFFQSDTDQLDVVLVQDWLKSRDLPGRQPAVGSAEPPKKDDHASLVCPQLAKRDLRSRGCFGHHVIGYVLYQAHLACSCQPFVTLDSLFTLSLSTHC